MRTIQVPGFPTQFGEYIEFPNFGEILTYPSFHFASDDQVRKKGSDFQRYLLDQAPISNKRKYVFISASVRYLYPGIFANKLEKADRNEWHIDSLGDENISHIIMSEGSCKTEFNTRPFSFEIPQEEEIRSYDYFLNLAIQKEKEWDLSPQKAPGQRFITFTNHVHRASVPDKIEFRFFYRVLETNEDLSQRTRIFRNTVVYNKEGFLPNIDTYSNGFFIHYPNHFES